MTINEGLIWQKTLAQRHTELVNLRNENSHTTTRRYGMGGDKEVTTTPTYDVVKLDRMITTVAREQRLLDMALKVTNAQTEIVNYRHDDAVLGEL